MAKRKTVIDPSDGLVASVVQDWAEEKYALVTHYAQMFSTAMKGKWARTYVELYSGSGRASIEGTSRFVDTAALRALHAKPPFDHFVFGELDRSLLDALEKRAAAIGAANRSDFVLGDVNKTWPEILERVRLAARGGRHLMFCFVDPFNCTDLAFDTMRGLSSLYGDFLILLASFMDANRARRTYIPETSSTLDTFFGDTSWRDKWVIAEAKKMRFGDFVADHFGLRMATLGYLYEGLADMKLIDATDNSRPLYHLAYFSRSPLGLKFWRETKKSANPQRTLFNV